MQFLILSDLHANWDALQAVLADASGKHEQIVCCGDIVGYNPEPERVLDWTRTHCAQVIRGNHDKVVSGLDDLEWFNEIAQRAAIWTMAKLSTEQLRYLHELARGPVSVDGFQIWHGAPGDEDEYVTNVDEAAPQFARMQSFIGFFGHTHLQGGFFAKHGRVGRISKVKDDEQEYVLELEPDVQYMINPGSVGQPRDDDARAAYALYDSDRLIVTFRRVPYPARVTAAKLKAVGLPDPLGQRLLIGI